MWLDKICVKRFWKKFLKMSSSIIVFKKQIRRVLLFFRNQDNDENQNILLINYKNVFID